MIKLVLPLFFLALSTGCSTTTVKYDDASWHYEGDFPSTLSTKAGGTHIAMFLAWALLSEHGSELHYREYSEYFSDLKNRSVTPGQYLDQYCDGKLLSEDLNKKANTFTAAYYESGQYYEDYERVLGKDLPTLYHADDSWQNFEKIGSMLDLRYAQWNKEN